MIKLLAVLAALVLASGCATKEGISLPTSKPTQADVGDFNRRNAHQSPQTSPPSPPLKDVVKTSLVPAVSGPKVIVVGNAMALTTFDEPTLIQRYENYVKQLAGKPAAFTKEWYLATSAGQTSVKYSGVTGIYTRFYRAEVPKDIVRQMGFASAFGTFMAGTSADLVAAQVVPGYGSWVTHVLCSEKDPNYSACEQQYRQGVYQSSDGREIDTTLKLVEGGGVIDPVSFKRFTGNPAQPTPPIAVSQPPSPPAQASPQASTTQPSAPTAVVAPQRDEAAQLVKLKELLDKGLITKDEYEKKRKEILDRL